MKDRYNKILKFLVSIIICEMAGVIGSFFTASQINAWYKFLNKPSFNPPSWIFGPVWTIIFILMGISLYLVWSKKFVVKNELKIKDKKAWNHLSQKFFNGSWQKANIVLIFVFQLILNILWSVIFFGFQSPGPAFFELLMLWVSVVYMIVNFYRVSKNAAWLLLPYILWISFAAVLNYYIWILN